MYDSAIVRRRPSKGLMFLAGILFIAAALLFLNSIGFAADKYWRWHYFFAVGLFFPALLALMLGVGLLRLRAWAWYLALWLSAVLTLVVFSLIVVVLFLYGFSWAVLAQGIFFLLVCWLPAVFFLTRPKVKAQFF